MLLSNITCTIVFIFISKHHMLNPNTLQGYRFFWLCDFKTSYVKSKLSMVLIKAFLVFYFKTSYVKSKHQAQQAREEAKQHFKTSYVKSKRREKRSHTLFLSLHSSGFRKCLYRPFQNIIY